MTTDEKIELHMLARDEASKVILQHLTLCPFAQLRIEERLRSIETNYARLTGFMIGSGLLGGALGAGISKLIST
jgi:hypothetical protein